MSLASANKHSNTPSRYKFILALLLRSILTCFEHYILHVQLHRITQT